MISITILFIYNNKKDIIIYTLVVEIRVIYKNLIIIIILNKFKICIGNQ
jgi:hypothetical protein